MRTTLDLTDEAYHLAKTVARENRQSLGATVSNLITQRTTNTRSPEKVNGLPIFHCVRRVTSEDVRALEDDE